MKRFYVPLAFLLCLAAHSGAEPYDAQLLDETDRYSIDAPTAMDFPDEEEQAVDSVETATQPWIIDSIDEYDAILDENLDYFDEQSIPDEFLAPDAIKKVVCYDAEYGSHPTPEPPEDGVEYVYVEEKRILALIPGPMGLNMTMQLRDKMKADPFFVQVQGYDDFGVIGVPYTKQREPLLASVEKSLATFVEKHGECVTLDLLGHSLGGFVALAAGSRNQVRLGNGSFLSETIGQLVTLAGATWGQTPAEDVPADLAAWVPLMPDLQPHISVPNTFLQGFRQTHSSAYDEWSKCSLYSTGDQSVQSPHDAGCFQGSPCVNVPASPRGWVHFLWLIDGTTEQDSADHNKFYSAMKSNCWGNSPAEGESESP